MNFIFRMLKSRLLEGSLIGVLFIATSGNLIADTLIEPDNPLINITEDSILPTPRHLASTGQAPQSR